MCKYYVFPCSKVMARLTISFQFLALAIGCAVCIFWGHARTDSTCKPSLRPSTPSTKSVRRLSRAIWLVVMAPKSQLSAAWRNSTLYCAPDSPAFWLRHWNLYLSKLIFCRGLLCSSNLRETSSELPSLSPSLCWKASHCDSVFANHPQECRVLYALFLADASSMPVTISNRFHVLSQAMHPRNCGQFIVDAQLFWRRNVWYCRHRQIGGGAAIDYERTSRQAGIGHAILFSISTQNRFEHSPQAIMSRTRC